MRFTALLLVTLPILLIAGCATRHTHVEPLFRDVHTLRVAALYNGEDFQFRYEFPTSTPSWYHDYLVYRSGEWKPADSSGMDGPLLSGLYEDRISVMIDDGSVPAFADYGAYIVSHPGIRSYPGAIDADELAGSFITERGHGDRVDKFILESRHEREGEPVWRTARSEEELMALREQGVFLNTWQWRAHRSNPAGYADQGYVLEYRNSSEGTGMYFTNWDGDTNQPLHMYNPATTGISALRIERLLARLYTQDDPYFLHVDDAVPFDPNHGWQEGDTLPRRILREPSGSRGSVRADGRWSEGAWRVAVSRSMEAPNPLDSKSLEPGSTYNVQFAVHTGAAGAHWHLVSMPVSLGLNTPGDLVAQRVEGSLDEAKVEEWLELPMIYPGMLTMEDIQENPRVEALVRHAVENPMDREALGDLLGFALRHQAKLMR
ncbi:MAG: hypothetical protein JJU11_01165 [Candidatus Sumerlaeia bacterium]|nr:hypothetical protein [Candidatus Sumerlaeia bacterium]